MVNLLSLVDKPYLFPLLGLFKQVDPLMTTIFPDEITANIHHGQFAVSRGQTVSLPILWARQASGPSDDNHLPCRYHRQHCSPPWLFPTLLDVRILKIKHEDPRLCPTPY